MNQARNKSGNKPVALLAIWLSRCFFFLAYSSMLKMEVICCSEMSVDFQRTTGVTIGVSRVWQAGHVPWGATGRGLLVRLGINILELILFY
jgi:hypothetical protein